MQLWCFILLKYRFGRNLYVIGSSVEVARLGGIKTRKMHYLVYAFAGFYISSIIMLALSRWYGQPGTGEGYDMSAMAAAVIGGLLCPAERVLCGTLPEPF